MTTPRRPRTVPLAAAGTALVLGLGTFAAVSSDPKRSTHNLNPGGAVQVICKAPAIEKPALTVTKQNAATASAACATSATPTTAPVPVTTAPPTTQNPPTSPPSTVPTPTTTTPLSLACPSYPAFPDASCTGWQHTGVTLTAYTGPKAITSGTVIDGKQIDGDIFLSGSGITIRRSKINGTVNLGYGDASGVLLEDVEVNAGNTTYAAIGSAGFTCRRCNIYGGGQGINGYSFTVEDSWIHDQYGTGTVHSEAILGYNGNIVVRHSRLSGNYNSSSGNFAASDGGMSSAVSFYTHGSWGPISDVVFEKNLLRVGSGDRDFAGYCLYGGGGLTSSATFVDNVFVRNPAKPEACGYYGTVVDVPSGSGSTWARNRYEDGTAV